MKKHIPNLITCLNLFSGCVGIYAAMHDHLAWACYMIFIGAFLDFFDGFSARILKVNSQLGKELDSMADMVTFGVLPGFLVVKLLALTYQSTDTTEMALATLPGFIITVFSGIRLAKFNIDTRQTTSFIGLPTPANSVFVAGLPLIVLFQPEFSDLILNRWYLYAMTIVLSFLLIAEIPLFSLKFKTFGIRNNKTRYTFLLGSIILLSIFHFLGLPLIVLLYVILSINQNIFYNLKAPQHEI